MFYVQIRCLIHQLKFVVDRVLEVKLNFSKEQQQFFYVLPNLMIFPIPSIHYPTESITYFRLIEIKFWKSVFKIVINSGNSKVSNFYTQQHCILLIMYIYFSKTYINWWLIFQKKIIFFSSFFKGKSNSGRICSINSVCGSCSNGGIGKLWWLKEPRKRWQIENKTQPLGDNRQNS